MLAAAAKVSRKIRAIVSRGGRPDYVPTYLPHVKAPTLLLVGGKDNPILEPNRGALKLIGSKIKKLAVVDGASHLFEEPGKMNEVARLSVAWFEKHLLSGRPVRGKLPTRRHDIQPL